MDSSVHAFAGRSRRVYSMRILLPIPALVAATALLARAETAALGSAEMVDAAHMRLLPGSPFYDGQELHRTGYVGQLDPDRLLFDYHKLAGLPQPAGITAGYGGWDGGFIADTWPATTSPPPRAWPPPPATIPATRSPSPPRHPATLP